MMKEKIKKCVNKIKKENLDSLLISNPLNITYLTGFREAEGYLLITREEKLIYFTNFLYQEEAKKMAWKVIVSNGQIFKLIKEEIKQLGLKKVGFEAKNIPFLEYKKISEELTGEKIDFLETIDLIESLRVVKEEEEISLIKKSIKVSEEAFCFAEEICDEAMSEKELSIELEKFLRLKSDNQLAFSPIVASEKSTVFPHYLPQDKKMDGNFFLIDLGSKYYGYCADLTKIFFRGKISPLIQRIYDIVRKAQELAVNKIKEGITAKKVDRAAREFIEKKGYGKYFGHGLGHGVGLAVHELPFLNHKNEEILKEGMVLTVEPAIYIEGKIGIRAEDMVLVKKEKGEILNGNIHR